MGKHYHACHECDELCQVSDEKHPGIYKCPTCNHILFAIRPNMIEKIFALNLAALVLFLLTNYFPFLSFHVAGNTSHANFSTSIYYLFQDNQWLSATAILLTTIVIPFMRIVIYLLLFGPLYFGYLPRYAKQMLQLLEGLLPWGMIDVFLIGILVSIVKLVKMGTVIPNISLWAFIAMVLVLAAAQASFHPYQIWEIIEKKEKRKALKRARA